MYQRQIAVRGIIYKDGKIYAQKLKNKNGEESNFWSMPGGRIEDGESLLDCLEREMKDQKFLEEFYEKVILPKYSDCLDLAEIKWIDHSRLDDSYVWAHYFESNNKQYILLSNDYAESSYLDDGLSHEIVSCNTKNSIELHFSDGSEVNNITGRFTLYREK
jgi:hypothetical protein